MEFRERKEMGIFWTAVYFYNIHGKRRGPYCRYGISEQGRE